VLANIDRKHIQSRCTSCLHFILRASERSHARSRKESGCRWESIEIEADDLEDVHDDVPKVQSQNSFVQEKEYVGLPDFSGVTMKMLHSILDIKRKRCAASNSNGSRTQDDGHWILSAFPTDY